MPKHDSTGHRPDRPVTKPAQWQATLAHAQLCSLIKTNHSRQLTTHFPTSASQLTTHFPTSASLFTITIIVNRSIVKIPSNQQHPPTNFKHNSIIDFENKFLILFKHSSVMAPPLLGKSGLAWAVLTAISLSLTPPGNAAPAHKASTPLSYGEIHRDFQIAHSSPNFTVYDCADPNVKVEPISLQEPAPCNTPSLNFATPLNFSGQLIFNAAEVDVTAYECHITMDVRVTTCGNWARPNANYGNDWPIRDQEVLISADECRHAIEQGSLTIRTSSDAISLMVNKKHSTRVKWPRNGYRNSDGYCSSTDFTGMDGNWYENSYEEVWYRADITPIKGVLYPDSGMVVWSNNIKADYSSRAVTDEITGTTLVWEIEDLSCADENSLIYQGIMQVHRKSDISSLHDTNFHALVTGSNSSTNQNFALQLRDRIQICGKQCYSTSQEQMSVCLKEPVDETIPNIRFNPELDISKAVIDSNVQYNQVMTNMNAEELFNQKSMAICEVERRDLHNTLNDIRSGGDGHALRLTHGDGVDVVRTGGTTHLIHCVPRQARLSVYKDCTQEIPVIFKDREGNDVEGFANPNTKILQEFSSVAPCSSWMPNMWPINNKWYCNSASNSHAILCQAPSKLSPKLVDFGFFDFAKALGTSAFSKKQYNGFRDHIRMKNAREPVLSQAAKEALNNGVAVPISVSHIRSQVTDVLSNAWPLFKLLGTAVQYISVMVIVWYIVNYIISVAINMTFLVRVRGCGCFILAALCEVTFKFFTLPAKRARDCAVSAAEAGQQAGNINAEPAPQAPIQALVLAPPNPSDKKYFL